MQKDSRIKKNVLSSVAYQVVMIGLSFILPRLYLENFGSEINGVLSTIKQIFVYMFLLEAGVGLATTQALYKTIGTGDHKSSSAILAATHKYYVKTGIIYLALVLVIAFVYSYIIPNAVPGHVLFLIIILTAAPALFSYFVQAKYRILMEVDGRRYVINNSETIVQLLSNAAKVAVLLLTDSLVLIQLVYCIIALFQLGFLYIYAKRRYKWLDLHTEPDFEAISQKNSVLLHQVSGMVFNNTDIILLSVLTDFKVVSIYTIYNIFFSQVQTFITSIISGISFALGQMFHTDREKFDRVYDAYETLYIMATFIVYTLMAVFLLPIIRIYTDGINDANYINATLLLLFVIMNLLANGKLPANGVLEYAGRFSETRSHAIWEMSINIIASVIAIKLFGICGAIFGTILALSYRSIVMIHFTNKKILGRSLWQTYRAWVVNGAVFAVVMLIFFVDSFTELSFGALIIKGLIHSVWIIALYVGANLLTKKGLVPGVLGLLRKEEKV